MKVLVTGFDPFGGESINPAWEALKKLPEKIDNISVVTAQLPTVFNDSQTVLLNAIQEHQPNIVLCVGQAGGRFEFCVERIAVNFDDARIPDNKGNQPLDRKIYDDGENAYFTSLPVKKIVQAVRNQGIPASVSYTAGTFVCNHVFYTLLYQISKKNISVEAGGFIHVPYLPSQVIEKQNQAYMSADMIVEALLTSVRAIATGMDDISTVAGKIS
ncbi:MAG: pyroglutamyl-peptidase I [Brevinema sp.]